MPKYVEWIEPLGKGKYSIICRADVNDVIRYMLDEYQERHKNHPNYPYPSEEEALADFITIHWAVLKDAD